ncbi:hypothetical protein OESDEN_01136 [Oesophagostomum dentatum]|uniref:Uncharacterized protein n=1 Tax=Oesophagostomum dentatum TaxID=61180 RepID=A0A0B1TMT7_OESDE|nr:hypothetical protein OESDEN_01136 [Oesophagostomum dentatum]
MAELQVFKAKINNACALLKANEMQVQRLETPFTFPESRVECENYIRWKMGETAHLLIAVQNAVKLQEARINAAVHHIAARTEQKDWEKLLVELDRHLETESHQLEVQATQWQNQIQFRQHELKQLAAMLNRSTLSTSNQPNTDMGEAASYKEFNSFWTVFDSLIQTDEELSEVDKFLFLKQTLKGKAAVAISCIPVVGGRYQTAVNILKKHFDRSASMADIIINEIERLQRASDTIRSCHGTFDAVSSRIIYLQQTIMQLNADRRKTERDEPVDVNEIVSAIDRVTTPRETTSLTTETMFSEKSRESSLPRTRTTSPRWKDTRSLPKMQTRLCYADKHILYITIRGFHLQRPDA